MVEKKKTCKDCVSFEYEDEVTTVCCAGIGVRSSDAEPCIYFEERAALQPPN